MKELTFREVIANIKGGEVWESRYKRIYINDTRLMVENTDSSTFEAVVAIGFFINDTYKLKRKKYSFTEAFKAYEEGKEIESCYSGTRFCDNEYLKIGPYANWKLEVSFKCDEIRNDWYINEV